VTSDLWPVKKEEEFTTEVAEDTEKIRRRKSGAEKKAA
jgi:hypothetical protein